MGLTDDALAARLLQMEAELDAATGPSPRSASEGMGAGFRLTALPAPLTCYGGSR